MCIYSSAYHVSLQPRFQGIQEGTHGSSLFHLILTTILWKWGQTLSFRLKWGSECRSSDILIPIPRSYKMRGQVSLFFKKHTRKGQRYVWVRSTAGWGGGKNVPSSLHVHFFRHKSQHPYFTQGCEYTHANISITPSLALNTSLSPKYHDLPS